MFRTITKSVEAVRTLLHLRGHIDDRLDDVLFAQGTMLARTAREWSGARLSDHEFKVFSQWGHDGIIQKLVRHVDIPNKVFVECGVQDFREANCRFLMMHDNGRGLVMESNENDIQKRRGSSMAWRYHLASVNAFVDCGNIEALIAKVGFGNDIGILSIDIPAGGQRRHRALAV
ncbi:MAG: hypothetical protein ACKON8_09195 [Planctomycetota bacterium]